MFNEPCSFNNLLEVAILDIIDDLAFSEADVKTYLFLFIILVNLIHTSPDPTMIKDEALLQLALI